LESLSERFLPADELIANQSSSFFQSSSKRQNCILGTKIFILWMGLKRL